MIRQEEIVQRLVKHEGLRLKPYKCSTGKLTIGVAHNLTDTPLSPEELKEFDEISNGIIKE